MDLAAMPEKRFLAFSKMYDCPTIESCPIAPKSPGNPWKDLCNHRAQRQVCPVPDGIGSIWVPNTQTCFLSANCFICE